MSRLLSRSRPARTASPLLTHTARSPQHPGRYPKTAFPRGRVEVEAGPVFVQGFLAVILAWVSTSLLRWSCCLRWAQCVLPGLLRLFLPRLCQPWRPQERPFSSIALANTSGNGDSPAPCSVPSSWYQHSNHLLGLPWRCTKVIFNTFILIQASIVCFTAQGS